MFECPLCGKKTKVVQTNHETIKMKLPKKYGPDGTILETAEREMPMIKRKIKCLDCGAYFITKELYERLTEETIRSGFDERDMVRTVNGVPAKVNIKLSRGIDWNEVLKKMANFDDTGAIYSSKGGD